MATRLNWMALGLAIVTELFLGAHTGGPGWLVLVAVSMACVVRLQQALERRPALWTWALWTWPVGIGLALVTFDSDMVHTVGPGLCLTGILIAGYWSIVGDVPFERLARPLPRCWWVGLIGLVPQGFCGAQSIQLRTNDPHLPRRLGLGLALSIPLLLVFGSLLCADQAFSDFLSHHLDTLSLDWLPPLSRTLLFWLLAMGWLRVLANHTMVAPDPLPDAQQADPLVIGIPIGMLNLLFGTFLAVQADYLFGGQRYASRPNLSYATYLHQGYFELVAVTVLAALVVLVVYRLSYRQEGGGWPLGLSGLLVLQCYGIGASAWQRFTLYTDTYGLTVLRLYAGAGLVVACVLMGLMFYGVVRGRSLAWLAARLSLALSLTVALVGGLNVEGWVANYNAPAMLAHHIPPDYAYLGSLSMDAVPGLVAAYDAAPPAERTTLSNVLTSLNTRLHADDPSWQSFTWSRWQAERLLTARAIPVKNN